MIQDFKQFLAHLSAAVVKKMAYFLLAKFNSAEFLTKALLLGVLINDPLKREFYTNDLATTKIQKNNTSPLYK
jgi:hypothetical protein